MLFNRDDKMVKGLIDSRCICIFDTILANAVSGAKGKNKCIGASLEERPRYFLRLYCFDP